MDKDKMFGCAYTILDNVKAIISELEQDNPHSKYINEKLVPIENDVRVLRHQLYIEELKLHIDDWKAYERVRKSGLYNMFDQRARELTNLSVERFVYCMEHYTELRELAEREIKDE